MRFAQFSRGQKFGMRSPDGNLILGEAEAKFLNQLAVELERIDSLVPMPPLTIAQDAAGNRLAVDLPIEIDARLSGSSSPYSFTEQVGTPGGGYEDAPGGKTGANAYEVNGTTGLDGKVALLRYCKTADDWRFQFVRWKFCTITVRANGCASSPINGASITVTDSNGTVVGTCTTSAGGTCTVKIAPGTYTFAATATGYSGTSTSQAISFSCTPSPVTLTLTPLIPLPISVTIRGCNTLGLAGVSYSATDGTTTVTGTVSSGGSVPVPNIGTWTVTFSKSRFNSNSGVSTITGYCSTPGITLTLTPATGYHCFTICADPAPDTLQCFDVVWGITATLTYNGSSEWVGTVLFNFPGCPPVVGKTTCPTPVTGVLYKYRLFQNQSGATRFEYSCETGPPGICPIAGTGVFGAGGLATANYAGTCTAAGMMWTFTGSHSPSTGLPAIYCVADTPQFVVTE